MEFIDIATHTFRGEISKSFSIKRFDNEKYVIYGSHGQGIILEMYYNSQNLTQSFGFTIDYIKVPFDKPISIKDHVDFNRCFKNADLLDKQQLLLDPIYLGEKSDSQLITPQINTLCFPPKNCFNNRNSLPIAIVTSYGLCEIRMRSDRSRFYDKCLHNINKKWNDFYLEKLLNTKIATFESFKNYVDNLHITTCEWADIVAKPNTALFYCTTASGMIICYEIINDNIELLFNYKTDMYKINILKYFTINIDNNYKSFLIAGNLNGSIKVLTLKDDKINFETDLWIKHDKMKCKTFETNYSKDSNHIFIVTSKGAHFLVFLIDINGKLITKTSYYIGNIEITGLETFQPNQWIITTISGFTANIIVNYNNEKLNIISTMMNNNLDIKNYQVLGMITTKNKSSWFFLMFPHRVYELTFKNLILLIITTINIIDPIEILLNNKTLNLTNYIDCFETIRCGNFKQIYKKNYDFLNLENIQIINNDEFQYKLRIYYFLMMIKYCNQKKRPNEELEIINIRNCIQTILAYKRLRNLQNSKILTNFQKISQIYMRKMIENFLKTEFDDKLKNIQEILEPIFKSFLKEIENSTNAICEKCVYCNEDVDFDTKTCKNKHEMSRCCITFIQVPMFTRRHCSQCNQLAFDDENLLRQILYENEEIKCPFCDHYLTIEI